MEVAKPETDGLTFPAFPYENKHQKQLDEWKAQSDTFFGGSVVPKADSVKPVDSKVTPEAVGSRELRLLEMQEMDLLDKLADTEDIAERERLQIKYDAVVAKRESLEAAPVETAPTETKPAEPEPVEAKPSEVIATKKAPLAIPTSKAPRITFAGVPATNRQRIDQWRVSRSGLAGSAVTAKEVLGNEVQTLPLSLERENISRVDLPKDIRERMQINATPQTLAAPQEIPVPLKIPAAGAESGTGEGKDISAPDSDITADNATITLHVDNLYLDSHNVMLEARDLMTRNVGSNHIATMNV
jgi:hypothetical protein